METALELRTWIEVSERNILSNVKAIRKLMQPGVLLLGVVKSNAYGHELVGFARQLAKAGVDWLGVDSVTEGTALRRAGLKLPILIQGYTLPGNFSLAAKNKLHVSISTFESLKVLAGMKARPEVHIKLDTGMHRHGFQLSDLPLLTRVLEKDEIVVSGIYTHIGGGKGQANRSLSEKQLAEFKSSLTKLQFVSDNSPLGHALATAGLMSFPESQHDMVRVGMGLYGYFPSPELQTQFSKSVQLKPALTWKAIVAELKWVEKGERVGYDYTEELKRKTRLAIIPVGYWHGFPRALSSVGTVLIGGVRCKVVGRVSMDIIAVDVTDSPKAKVGGEVVLIGRQGKESILADELAALAGTTTYEYLTRLNPLIKKLFV